MKRSYNIKLILFISVALLIVIGCIFTGIKKFKKVQQTSSSRAETEGIKTDDNSLEGGGDSAEGDLSAKGYFGENPAGNSNNGVFGQDRFVVMLDAGHGGKDEGTHYGDILEKDITIDVVNYMREYLEDAGVLVLLTRKDDTFFQLKERTDMSNEIGANLFVSIHCNYFEDDSAINGFECYYCDDRDDSRIYAEKIVKHMQQASDCFVRGIKEEDYYVLKNTICPSVLVELGYLSNNTERRNLSSHDYQKRMAKELVNGILKGISHVSDDKV